MGRTLLCENRKGPGLRSDRAPSWRCYAPAILVCNSSSRGAYVAAGEGVLFHLDDADLYIGPFLGGGIELAAGQHVQPGLETGSAATMASTAEFTAGRKSSMVTQPT